MIDILLWVVGPILLLILASRAFNAYSEFNVNGNQVEGNERENIRQQIRKTTVHVDVFLENINDHWYGWTVSSKGQEVFVGQGATWDEAKERCADRLMEKGNGVIYVVKFIKR